MVRILACVDGSPYSIGVCDHAAWLANRLSASIEVLHVHDRHPGDQSIADFSGNLGLGEGEALLRELTALDEQRGRLAQRRSQVILDAAAARLRANGVVDIVTRQRHGSLADAIIEAEPRANVVVIGVRGGEAGTAPDHLGSSLERVVRAVHHPILVAQRAFRPIRRVLVAYDGGASARKAVDYLTSTLPTGSLECHVLVVGDDGEENRRKVRSATERLERAGFVVRGTILPGHAEQVIGATVQSSDIDLLVMGAFGHSRVRHLMVGSTTTATLRASVVPVLLFR